MRVPLVASSATLAALAVGLPAGAQVTIVREPLYALDGRAIVNANKVIARTRFSRARGSSIHTSSPCGRHAQRSARWRSSSASSPIGSTTFSPTHVAPACAPTTPATPAPTSSSWPSRSTTVAASATRRRSRCAGPSYGAAARSPRRRAPRHGSLASSSSSASSWFWARTHDSRRSRRPASSASTTITRSPPSC